MTHASYEDDTPRQEIEVRLGSVTKRDIVESSDPFMVKGDELAKFSGIGANLKRRNSRALSKVHAGTHEARSKKREENDVTGYNLFGVAYPPYNLDYLAKLHEINPAHYAASWAKTTNIVGLGYDFELSARSKIQLEAIEDEKKLAKIRKKMALAKIDLQEWLESCNTDDDFLVSLRKAWIDYEATGNGYIEIGRTVTGAVGYIGHIPATTMRVRKDRDGFVQIVDNKAVFFRNFGDTVTSNPLEGDNNPNEVIHLYKYSPTNGYYGVPDIISAKNAIAGNEFAARFNLDYFENKAVPRYVIIVKGNQQLSLASQNRLTEFFEVGLKGKNHRSIYVPLPADRGDEKSSFEMKPIEAGVQDSSFDNYRKANLADILMAHRVPITKVSMSEGSSLAAARDADKTFKEQVCKPEQRILENKLNRVFKEVTDVFVLRLTELTLTDEDTQSQIDERYLRNKVITPNEVRARKGMPGLEGGDEVIELKPQQAADARATAGQTRERDRQRANNAPDKAGEARQPQGEGRAVKYMNGEDQ